MERDISYTGMSLSFAKWYFTYDRIGIQLIRHVDRCLPWRWARKTADLLSLFHSTTGSSPYRHSIVEMTSFVDHCDSREQSVPVRTLTNTASRERYIKTKVFQSFITLPSMFFFCPTRLTKRWGTHEANAHDAMASTRQNWTKHHTV